VITGTTARHTPSGGLVLLSAAQGLLTTSVLVAQTLGTIELRRMSGSISFAGAALAAQLLGAVASLVVIGRGRDGRRPGGVVLCVGFAMCSLGLLLGALAVAWRSTTLLLVGSGVFGAGAAAALLLRTAAVEGRPLSTRGRTVGTVALGGVAGAALGPAISSLSGVAEGPWGRSIPWWAAAASCAAMAAAVRRFRVPVQGFSTDSGKDRPDPRSAVLAAAVCCAAAVVMVIVMLSVTLRLHRLGVSDATITGSLASHYAAMYGFAIPFGLAADRWGRRGALLCAGALLAAAGLGLAADPDHTWVLTAVLVSAGSGWSGAFVGGSAALADAAPPGQGVALTARSDLIVAVVSASTAMWGTALLAAEGARGVGVAALVGAAVALAAAAALRRQPRR